MLTAPEGKCYMNRDSGEKCVIPGCLWQNFKIFVVIGFKLPNDTQTLPPQKKKETHAFFPLTLEIVI